MTSITSSPFAGIPGTTIVQKASSASSTPTDLPMKNPGGLSSGALSAICIAAVLVFFLFIGIISAMFYYYGKKAAMGRRASANRWPSASSYSTIPDKPELGLGRMLPAEMGSDLAAPKPAAKPVELEVPRTASELEGHRMSKLMETGWGRRAELEWNSKSGWI